MMRAVHLVAIAAVLAAGCGDSSVERPPPTATASPTASASASASPTVTTTATARATSTSTTSASATPTATATATATATVTPLPVGLAALTDLDALAQLRRHGTRVEQTSSYDHSGGNADLGVGPDTAELLELLGAEPVELDNSYLYRDGERFVILDQIGPGVVYRMWMTGLDALFRGGLTGDVWFELDDEAEPRLHLARGELFSGTVPPFLAPLAGNSVASAGGFYSVVPVPFAHRLRILTSTVPNWVQITYAKLPPEQSIESFDPSADTSAAAAVLEAVGSDPKSRTPTSTDTMALNVAPGAVQTVWQRDGAGAILRLELLAPAGAEIPTRLRLQATWDDAAAPQVDAALDDFFGAGLGPAARSLAFGRDGDRFYCYFTMPFRSRARIAVRNDGDVAALDGWQLRVGATEKVPDAQAAWFYARTKMLRVDADRQDYVILDATGTGHVVGVVLTAGCAEEGHCQLAQLPGLDGAHLEGDERIAIDGSRYPQIHGTGLEDFFNGGFYFLFGPRVLPTHGNPAQPATSERRPGLTLRTAYRLFLGDAIPFSSRIRLAIEHGPTNDVPAEMSSLVFYYASQQPTLIESDRIAVGDPASEAAHEFSADGRVERELRSAFRGDDSDSQMDAIGVEATRTSFRVAVDPANRGVRLRRLADIALGRQSAQVRVDGQLAGIWYSADINPLLRWAELDFEVPPALTAGRDTVQISVDASSSPTPWTSYGYTVFSYVDSEPRRTAPSPR